MRKLLVPKYERFDFEQAIDDLNKKSVNQMIEKIASMFDQYLAELRLFAATKSALMGPIGKVLDQARVKGFDSEFLKGYGISTHKNTVRKALDSRTLEPLEEGIEQLSQLLNKVPRHMRPKVVEIISYKIYYRREKANVGFWEEWRSDFEQYLKKIFKDLPKLKQECKLKDKIGDRELKNFTDVVQLPKRLRTENLQKVVDEFSAQRKEIVLEEEEV